VRWQIPIIGVFLLSFTYLGCSNTPVEPTQESAAMDAGDLPASALFGSKKVIHFVSVGGADLCEATGRPTGCDANFSLVAQQRADGSVKGQWQDTFDGGRLGIHVAIDCLKVVGNGAVISGVITHGVSEETGGDVSGQQALTAVVDNGTSAKDPLDQIGYSLIGGTPGRCNRVPLERFTLEDLTHGQAIVR
jgi:hypothetical protein